MEAVVRYFRSDQEIADELSEADFSNIFNPSTHFLRLIRTAIEYQGFDPKVILRQLVRNKKTYDSMDHALLQWDMANVDDDFVIRDDTRMEDRFTNREKMTRDVSFLILLFLSRNNHISKIIKKAREGLSNVLDMLKEKYDINDDTRASGTQLGSSIVTLPRITGVFPAVAVRLFHQRAVKEIVLFESIPMTSEAISRGICCPFLPSTHPRDLRKGNHIHGLMLYVSVSLDDIIHRKEKAYTSLDNLISYYRAGYESAAMPEKSRLEVFSRIGLLSTGTTDFIDQVKVCNAACIEKLKDMRSSDPDHSRLMRIANTGLLD